jgi:hypothetical protein
MSKHEGELVSVRIIPNERGKPPGTLANAEVVFAPMPARSAASRWSGVPFGSVAMGGEA